MIVEHDFCVGIRDINYMRELTNTSLLAYFEDVACMHSEIAGFGINDMEKTKRTWVLLEWRIEVKKRPLFNDTLKVKTWSRKIDKFYAFRDFEIINKNNEIVAIATSKWLFIDIEKGKLIKVGEDVSKVYEQENKSVFEEKDLPKFAEPTEFSKEIEYKITKNMIDVNNHLNNIYYMDIVKECVPEELFTNEVNQFEILYKKEIKLGETVKALYTKTDEFDYVTIKSNDKKIVHAVIRLKNKG